MPEHTDERITIATLADISPAGGEVRGHRFTRCVIEGPAVVTPGSRNTFSHCDWGSSDAWWEPKSEVVVGVIQLNNCTFDRCRFYAVGFVADADTLARVQEQTATD